MKLTASSIRASFSALCLAVLAATAAEAGDAAYPAPLGFSAEGDRFAFAEWGREDGSGFAYANVYVIDLVKDAWLAAPIRVTLEDETATPAAAYAQALEAAAGALAKAGIAAPARLAHARPFQPPAADETAEVSWARHGALDGRSQSHSFGLEVFEIETAACPDPAFGFAFAWDGAEIYRDARLSRSRGCPEAYSVERIYVDDHSLKPRFAVALIGVHRRGFEGLDLRHMAAPIPLAPE